MCNHSAIPRSHTIISRSITRHHEEIELAIEVEEEEEEALEEEEDQWYATIFNNLDTMQENV
jgi:hypothetical protein